MVTTMKIWNQIITIVLTGLITSALSSVIIEIIIFGGISGELFQLITIFSLPVVFIVGTPIALLINFYFKTKKVSSYIIKILLHIAFGLILPFLMIVILGGVKEVFSRDSMIFYISGVINSILYLLIFTLFKLTGETGFDNNKMTE
jgi:hypothetical protein